MLWYRDLRHEIVRDFRKISEITDTWQSKVLEQDPIWSEKILENKKILEEIKKFLEYVFYRTPPGDWMNEWLI